jgi:hypothetical protein
MHVYFYFRTSSPLSTKLGTDIMLLETIVLSYFFAFIITNNIMADTQTYEVETTVTITTLLILDFHCGWMLILLLGFLGLVADISEVHASSVFWVGAG